jgi:hypothetical protein
MNKLLSEADEEREQGLVRADGMAVQVRVEAAQPYKLYQALHVRYRG